MHLSKIETLSFTREGFSNENVRVDEVEKVDASFNYDVISNCTTF